MIFWVNGDGEFFDGEGLGGWLSPSRYGSFPSAVCRQRGRNAAAAVPWTNASSETVSGANAMGGHDPLPRPRQKKKKHHTPTRN